MDGYDWISSIDVTSGHTYLFDVSTLSIKRVIRVNAVLSTQSKPRLQRLEQGTETLIKRG